MGRRPDPDLRTSWEELDALPTAVWISVRLARFRGKRNGRVDGYVVSVTPTDATIESLEHGLVTFTRRGLVNFRLMSGPFREGQFVERVSDPQWRGVVKQMEGSTTVVCETIAGVERVHAAELSCR